VREHAPGAITHPETKRDFHRLTGYRPDAVRGEAIFEIKERVRDLRQARPPSESEPDPFDQSPAWQPEEIPLGDGRTLVREDS
jgi:hypothetical protein